MKINNFARKAYTAYTAFGLTPEGACGLMGNQFSESMGFMANKLELLCMKRYKEKGKIYTDISYTQAVDSGKISRAEFLSPMGKHYGYGLVQWTTSERKAGLYDRAKKQGVSIADEDLQIEYVLWELKNRFPKVLQKLKTTKSVQEASDYVLQYYEQPNGWQSMKKTRASYGQTYYKELAGKDKSMGINNIITKERTYGNQPYMETGNNHQKFSDIVNGVGLAGCQDQPWCATYQFALEVEEFGKETALKHWNMTEKNYCGYSCFSTESMFRNAGKVGSVPKVGALVIFKHSHMGRVLSVDSKNKMFECGEGNTSNKKFDRNGDSCAVKTYSWSEYKIKSFCYIDYSTDKTESEPVSKPVTKPASKPSTDQSNVAKGQKWLNKNYGALIKKNLGELLETDGIYGEKSRWASVCVWKDLTNRKHKTKLTPSNRNFADSCKKAAKKVVVKKGTSGTYVYLIEFVLSAKGYYFGAMDASFGSALTASVKSFQKEKGLTADEVVGPNTWYKLFN